MVAGAPAANAGRARWRHTGSESGTSRARSEP
ncbi:hypothetical protein HMPREF1317_0551, partial [Schaalia georgiae F0490]